MNATRTESDVRASGGRRGILKRLLGAVAGALILGKAARAGEQVGARDVGGDCARLRMRKGNPPGEPLDTMVCWERSDASNGRAMTHEVLSIIHEEKGKNSYPWAMYAHLTTHHVEGDGCVLCSRLHKQDAGWACGLHSEVFNKGRGVGLGMNIEMTNDYEGSEEVKLIGLNIQAVGGRPCQYGIQVHDGKGSFERGVGLNGKGSVGLDVAGQYGVGVHAHGNSIRVNEGTCIELDEEGKIRIRYNKGRIEFLNGDKCVGHIDMGGKDHVL